MLAILLTSVTVFLLTTSHYAVAWLPAGGAATMLLLANRPAVGFFVLVFLFPFAAIREVGGIKIHWLISLALLLLMAIQLYADRETVSRMRGRLWPALLFLLFVNVFSAIFSEYPDTAWGTVVDLLLGGLFLLIALFFAGTENTLKALAWVIVCSVAGGALFAVLDTFLGINVLGIDADGPGMAQSKGLTLSHNALSLMIIVAIPLAVHNAWHANSVLVRFAALILLAIIIFGMLATYSRGGFLLTLLALALVTLQNRNAINKLHVGLFLMMCVAAPGLLYVAAPEGYFSHQTTLYDENTGSIDRRVTYLEVAKDAFFERPLIGHGPNAFRDIYAQSAQARRFAKEDTSNRRYAHNTYVDVLIGTGLLGLAAWLGVLILALANYTRAVSIAAEKGQAVLQYLFASYRLSLLLLSAYMLIKSAQDNKYLWLLLAVSDLSLRIARVAHPKTKREADACD